MSALMLKFGSWLEEGMTEAEQNDFRWICEHFALPMPQNPEDPSDEWMERVDQCIDDLPEEQQEEMRREVQEILSAHMA